MSFDLLIMAAVVFTLMMVGLVFTVLEFHKFK